MDILRFILFLPLRFARFFIDVVLAPLFGRIDWTPPTWPSALDADMRKRPDFYLRRAGGTLAVALVLVGGVEAWLHRPHPSLVNAITFEVATPDITDYEKPDGSPGTVVHPLEIRFSGSAAPIELVGKKVKQGVALDPDLKGTWLWVDDRTLRFTPAGDWPVGGHTEIRFDNAKLFAPHVVVADDHAAFDMQAFAITAGESEFYQDPQNPAAKKTIMALTFNYPVAPAELEKRIGLALQGRGADTASPLKFSVVYDAAKMRAFVHSAPLDLPRDDDQVVMTLDEGVKSARGGDGTTTALKMSVRVPGLYSLAISGITPTLVNNDKFEPEQVLVMNTSDTVRGSDLAGLVRAWVLPKRKAGFKQPDDAPPYGWSAGEVGEDVLRHSDPVKLELVPTEKDYADLQSFKFHAPPGARVYVRIAPGLKSFGGYLTGRATVDAFTVPDYPKLLRFMADGSLLSLSGDKRISVVSRNVPGMKLEIGRILPEQLQHLVSLNFGTFTQPQLYGPPDRESYRRALRGEARLPQGRPRCGAL